MPRTIIILGMHRSGTSCLTGSLQEAGLHLGRVNRRSHCNEKGTRENLEFMKVNDAVLATVGALWNNPPKENVKWSTEQIDWRRRVIAKTAQSPAWGFKDPRTIFTLDGWLEELPDARLIATFRNPHAVAQSLRKRNDIPLGQGLELWRAYNERLLEICRQRNVAVINFDWPIERYKNGLKALCAQTGLVAPVSGFKFFESKLRHNEPGSYSELPGSIRTIYRRLRHEARRTMLAAERSHATVEKINVHSVRLFPRGRGASQYKSTGIASRCDWVIHSDNGEPNFELRRQRETKTPRHIFLSLRAPFFAVEYFANEVLPHLTSPFVLISGSEDVTVPQQCDKRWRAYNERESDAFIRILDHKLLTRWFAENLVDGDDSRFTPLPTGVVFEDSTASHRITRPNPPQLIERPLRILCGHRVRKGEQWSLRRSVTSMARQDWARWCTVIEDEIPSNEFLQLMSSHAFVLCVEGGGVDPSPKAWQAILHGAIPIIRHSALAPAYRELPVAFVDEWTPEAITFERLEAWRRDLAPAHDIHENRIETVRRLSLDYWWDKIEDAARAAR